MSKIWKYLAVLAVLGTGLATGAYADLPYGSLLSGSYEVPLSGLTNGCIVEPTDSSGTPVIEINPPLKLDFSIVAPETESIPATFIISNSGTENAIINDAWAEETCMDIYWNVDPSGCSYQELAPGDTCTLTVRPRLNSGTTELSENAYCPATLVVAWKKMDYTNHETPASLALTVEGWPTVPIEIDAPGDAVLSMRYIYGTNPRRYEVKNVGESETSALSITFSDGRFYDSNAICQGSILAVSQTCNIIASSFSGAIFTAPVDVTVTAAAIKGGSVSETFPYTTGFPEGSAPTPTLTPVAVTDMDVVGPVPAGQTYAYGDWQTFTLSVPAGSSYMIDPYDSTDTSPWLHVASPVYGDPTTGDIHAYADFIGITSVSLGLAGENTDNFEIDSGDCGDFIADGSSCQFRVRSRAATAETLQASVQVYYQLQHELSSFIYNGSGWTIYEPDVTVSYKLQTLSSSLSGVASGLDGGSQEPDLAGLHITPVYNKVMMPVAMGGDLTMRGEPTLLEVSYFGDLPTAPLYVHFGTPANFVIENDHCNGISLSDGENCQLTVTPYAVVNTSYPPQAVIVVASSDGNAVTTWKGQDSAKIVTEIEDVNDLVGHSSLVLRPVNQSWTIVAPNIYGDAKLFALYNYGPGDSGTLRLTLGDTQHFEILGDHCSGQTLAGMASDASDLDVDGCTFYVRTQTQSWSNIFRTILTAMDGYSSATAGLTLNTYTSCVSPCVPNDPENPQGTCNSPPCEELVDQLCDGQSCPDTPDDTPKNPQTCLIEPCDVTEDPIDPDDLCADPPCDVPPDWPSGSCYPQLSLTQVPSLSVNGQGACQMQYGPCSSILVTNTGNCPTRPMSTSVGPTRFSGGRSFYNPATGSWQVGGSGYKLDVISNECQGKILEPGASCAIRVRPMAYRNVDMGTAFFTVSGFAPTDSEWVATSGDVFEDSFNRLSIRLSGTASNFACSPYMRGADLVLDSDNPEAQCALGSPVSKRLEWMYIEGQGRCLPDWIYGSSATAKVLNYGELPHSSALVTEIYGEDEINFPFGVDSCSGKILPGAASLNSPPSCEVTVQSRAKENGTFAGQLQVIGGACDNGAGGCHHNEIAKATVFANALGFSESDACCANPPCKSQCTGPQCCIDPNGCEDDGNNDYYDGYTCEANCRSCAGIAQYTLHPWDAPDGALCCNCVCFCNNACGGDDWCQVGCRLANCW